MAQNAIDDSQLGGRDSHGEIHATSVIVAPICGNNGILGTIHLYSTRIDLIPDPLDLEFTLAVAKPVGVALDNLRRRDALADDLNLVQAQTVELIKLLGAESEIIGISNGIEKVNQEIIRSAPSRSTVLIRGESGVGKELVARAIHEYGKRSAKSFIPVNCSAIPSDLLENELFGHEKGAYTGADSTKVGRFELADGGTILLDEIGDIPPFFQAKLLRVIQEREIWRVGGVKPIPIDVCVIAATNHDLVEETRNGRFREDLFYRLSVVPLVIPPLREKRDDIEPLVKHFWERYTEEYDAPPKTITPRALSALRRYDWPGNVRQLENLLRSVLVLSDADQVDIEDLPPEITDSSQIPVELSIEIPEEGVSWEEVEKQYILAALQRTGGNQIEAAALLRISRRKLQYRMGKHSIRSQDIR